MKSGPSEGSTTLLELPYDASTLRATGEVCTLDDVRWLRVRVGDATGWVDGLFAMPTTPPRDETEAYSNRMGADPAPSPESAVAALLEGVAPVADEESPYRAEQVGIATAGSFALGMLHGG